MLNCMGWNKKGVDIFPEAHAVKGGNNKMTYLENPNNSGGNRRGIIPTNGVK